MTAVLARFRDRVRRPVVIASAVVTLVALPSIFYPWPKLLLWNASASVPEGLYYLHPVGRLNVGDLVVVNLPLQARKLAATRRYLPANVPLIKPVAAMAGQKVCRVGGAIFIDGDFKAEALTHDSRKRPLPVWAGCETLSDDRIFLMNAAVPDSFDGRYFGPVDVHLITGKAIPLYIPRPSSTAVRVHAG